MANNQNINVPEVSIITPAYNSARFIAKTIESVQVQTYKQWEMIIVDDCSNDATCSIVESYIKNDSRIKMITFHENAGSSAARNAAIGIAQGRYIAFLDSDDLWFPDKIAKQLMFMKRMDAALTFTAYKKMSNQGLMGKGIVTVPSSITYEQLLTTNVIACLTAMYDVQKLGKVFLPNLRRRQDYALWLKILKKGDTAFGLNEPLAIYRVRGGSISGNKLTAASHQWRFYRDVERLPLTKSVYYLIKYGYCGLVKYFTF